MLRFWSTLLVRHLAVEIEYLRAQIEHERQRAELAIDELLRVRGVGPVTQPTAREARDAETHVDRLLHDAEFTATGVVD